MNIHMVLTITMENHQSDDELSVYRIHEKPQEIYFHFTKLINHEHRCAMCIVTYINGKNSHRLFSFHSLYHVLFKIVTIIYQLENVFKHCDCVIWLCKFVHRKLVAGSYDFFAREIFVWFLDFWRRHIEKFNPCRLNIGFYAPLLICMLRNTFRFMH